MKAPYLPNTVEIWGVRSRSQPWAQALFWCLAIHIISSQEEADSKVRDNL